MVRADSPDSPSVMRTTFAVEQRRALRGDEPKHVVDADVGRLLVDLGEEHPQVRCRGQQRVVPSSGFDELQIPVDNRMAQPVGGSGQRALRGG